MWVESIVCNISVVLVSFFRHSVDEDDAILANSRYDDGNSDSALNSSLRHVNMHERNANSVWLKPRI